MDYYCSTCKKRFGLDDPITLDQLKEARIVSTEGRLWHILCAKLLKTEQRSVYVDPKSKTGEVFVVGNDTKQAW